MDVKLLIKKGSNEKHEIPLVGAETMVGRQKGCKLRIPSGTVSRQHCRFLCEDDRLFVEDLNSSNGTFVNGVRVYGRQAVQPGDEVEIGPVVFVANYLLVETPTGEALEVVEEAFPIEMIPLEDEPLPARAKVAPATDQAPIPLALADEDEPILPVLLDEELTLGTTGDEDLRDLLSKMQ